MKQDSTLPGEQSSISPEQLPLTVIGRDLGLCLGGGLLLLGLIVLSPWITFLRPLRLLVGLAYVLYVPGYCLTAALFPAQDDLDGIERTGLSLGLSVAWVPVLALLLDRLPWGLRLWPIFLGELLSILVFSGVALWRRRRLSAEAAYAPDLSWRPRPWWRTLSLYEQRIYQLCAAALLLAGLAAAWVFLVPSPAEFMTEFYILGQEELAELYPREAVPGEVLDVTMGITNLERTPFTYRVEVWAVDPWNDQRQLVGEAGPISLAVEETHEQPLTWAMPWAGDDQIVDFYLFIPDQADTEPYRQLRLWLNVNEP